MPNQDGRPLPRTTCSGGWSVKPPLAHWRTQALLCERRFCDPSAHHASDPKTRRETDMLCVSINQESRRFALVDMLNAARQGDLLEIRLDRFGKSPDLGELLSRKPKPVIMTCRRAQDGGHWDGSEDERLAILRQCIISRADYVEIELDVADEIRPFPGSKRVISYTNLSETPADLHDIYDEARTKKPDVIKLVTNARTPEEAWPLVQIMARATVPTVVVGLGKPGIMLSVLGQKLKAPWVYAALERGMEAYPGQVAIDDLREVYDIGAIGPTTRLIGVTGFGERELITVGGLNAVFDKVGLPVRCLPLAIGDVKVFRKVLEAAKLVGAVIDPDHQEAILGMGPELHAAARQAGAADLLVLKGDTWHAQHVAGQAWIAALRAALAVRHGPDAPFRNRFAALVGLGAPARLLAAEVQRHGGSAILCAHDRKAGAAAAQELGCRFVPLEALYTTTHDVLIVTEPTTDPRGGAPAPLHAGYLRSEMVVMDLTGGYRPTPLLREAKARGCQVVDGRELLLSQLEQQTKLLTGKQVPREVFEQAIPERLREDE